MRLTNDADLFVPRIFIPTAATCGPTTPSVIAQIKFSVEVRRSHHSLAPGAGRNSCTHHPLRRTENVSVQCDQPLRRDMLPLVRFPLRARRQQNFSFDTVGAQQHTGDKARTRPETASKMRPRPGMRGECRSVAAKEPQHNQRLNSNEGGHRQGASFCDYVAKQRQNAQIRKDGSRSIGLLRGKGRRLDQLLEVDRTILGRIIPMSSTANKRRESFTNTCWNGSLATNLVRGEHSE